MNATRTFGQRLLLLIGSVGPLGHAPASGTVTVAVAGIPLFLLIRWLTLPLTWYLVFLALLTAAAVWVHHVGDRLLGEKDSRKLVLDELVGFFVAMTAVPATWQFILAGFLIERGIDIIKVPPANLVEKKVPGGWGVVGDDVIAGLYTLVLLHLGGYLLPGWLGLAG
ncbi:MAG TPA: phosphatidylglycerophosphatase A [Phycisphaerae bacterium]|nr:phosphatidylglycerophosphatase A [Phycisphaerae bacterium]